MRYRSALAFTLVAFTLQLAAQDGPPPPQVRYGIDPNPTFYPQATPKVVLASVVKAISNRKFEYLAAQLLEPKFVEGRIDERAKQLVDGVESEYRVIRDAQRKDSRVLAREQLPLEPKAFADAVQAEARNRAFRVVVQDIRAFWAENPEQVREFQKYLREATFTEAGESASAVLKGSKGEQINFIRIDGRWQVEDRKTPPEKK